MKKDIICLLLGISTLGLAQKNFVIKDGSNRFDAKIAVENCEGDTCSG